MTKSQELSPLKDVFLKSEGCRLSGVYLVPLYTGLYSWNEGLFLRKKKGIYAVQARLSDPRNNNKLVLS